MEQKNCMTYEYMSKTVSSMDQSKIIDVYESFGWEATNTENNLYGVTINFKRNRKIAHKNELLRLERKADDLIRNGNELEISKTRNASIFAYSFGIFSALVLGGGMSLCMLLTSNPVFLTVGIILGILGLGLCGLNYLIYRKKVASKTNRLESTIADNMDKIAVTCEQGQSLLAETKPE
ncbi:MAG: hypothetical protein WCS80_04550 [Bacilli bacterium]